MIADPRDCGIRNLDSVRNSVPRSEPEVSPHKIVMHPEQFTGGRPTP
jgi:hypothetical protein